MSLVDFITLELLKGLLLYIVRVLIILIFLIILISFGNLVNLAI